MPAGLIQGQNLNLALRGLLLPVATERSFDELHIPFRAVSTDLATGEEVVHAGGDLATAVRASMSIPGAFEPVVLDGRLLVDGMLSNNLPVVVAQELGADVVIAVDVGAELHTQGELDSAVAVADQVLSILTLRNTEHQIEALREGDVLVRPQLRGFGNVSFEESEEIVARGADAARAVQPALERHALAPDAWAHHLARLRGVPGEPLVVDRVEYAHESELERGRVENLVETGPGDVVDPEALGEDLRRVYGLQVFQTVDYQIDAERGETVLRVGTRERPWGPHYIRFGLNVEENFDNTSAYNLAINHTWNPANRWGGEWRNEVQLGSEIHLLSEFWQPIDEGSRWFVAPRIELQRQRVPVYEGDERRAEFAIRRVLGGVDAGRQLGDWGELRVGMRWEDGHSRPLVGSRDLASGDVDGGGVFVRFAVDTLDDANFPRRGAFVRATVGAARRAFGASRDFELATLSATQAVSFGEDTVLFSLQGTTTFDGPADLDDIARLGGFLSLSGLDRDQLAGRHVGLVRVMAYRRVATAGILNFRYPFYLGFSAEAGNAWQRRADVSFGSMQFAGSLFAGLKTPLGPVYLGYGVAEGGRDSAYLFLGRTF